MYAISFDGIGGSYVTITKNGKVIEPLDGLYVYDDEEKNELLELIRLANKAANEEGRWKFLPLP